MESSLLKAVDICPGNGIADRFFSDENVDLVNEQLRTVILLRHDIAIGPQDRTALSLIMKNMFATYYRGAPPGNEDEAISWLNALCLGIILPPLESNVLQYKGYLRDSARVPPPLPRP